MRYESPLRGVILELEDLVDPVLEVRDPGVDSGLVLLGAPDPPRDDPGEHEAPVLTLNNHRSAAVALEQKYFYAVSRFPVSSHVLKSL